MFSPAPSLEVIVEVADALAGVDPASFELAVDGTDATAGCTLAGGIATCTASPLTEGLHTLAATVSDLAGNSASARVDVELVIDADAPELNVNSPLEGVLFDQRSLNIAMGYSDATSGLDLSSVEVQLDGGVLTGCTVEATFAACEVTDLAPGPHLMSASVRDLAGNPATDSVAFEVVPDETPPEIAFIAPTESVLVNEPTIFVETAFTDTQAGIDVESFELALDGTVLESCGVEAASFASCVLPLLDDGTYILDAAVADGAGNVATASLTLEKVTDEDPPAVAITSHENQEVVNDTLLAVSGTVEDDRAIVELTVNGEPATVTGNAWSATVPLVEDRNLILVEALNEIGILGFDSIGVKLVIDDDGPTVEILSPAAGGFVGATPRFELRFTDANTIDLETLELAAGGTPLTADCELSELGGDCTLLETLASGPTVLSASIDDEFGNRGTASIDVEVDGQGVQVSFVSPAPDLVTADELLDVDGTFGDDVVSISVNGVEAELSGGTLLAGVELRKGTNMLVALATKANGNTGTASLRVTRDLAPPIVRIVTPREALVSVHPTIAVAGLVNDIVDGAVTPTVRVNGQEALVSNGTFLLPDVPLAEGENVLEAVATDAVGNQGRHEITVEFQPELGPRIEIVSGASQLGQVDQPLAEPLAVMVRDVFGVPLPGKPVRFEVTRNSGTLTRDGDDEPRRVVTVPTDGFGVASVGFTLGHTDGEGNHRVTTTALGTTGEVEFCASALPGAPANILMVGGENQRGAVGQPLAEPMAALVVDDFGNPQPDVDVTFEVVAGGGTLDGQETLVRSTDAHGMARAVLTLGPATGSGAQGCGRPSTSSTASRRRSAPPASNPATPLTRFKGVVLDNTLAPVPGAVVSSAQRRALSFRRRGALRRLVRQRDPADHRHRQGRSLPSLPRLPRSPRRVSAR